MMHVRLAGIDSSKSSKLFALFSISRSKTSSVPGRRQTATPGSPTTAKPRVSFPGKLVEISRSQCGHICRSTSIFLISAMALAGLRSFGQTLAQFMMVWQR
jgi:hypothetical protein